MSGKIKVYGQSQKWTALGIVAGYLKMYPQATLKDLNKAFPSSIINSNDDLLDTVGNIEKKAKADSNSKAIELVENMKKVKWYVSLQDGTQVGFTQLMWPEDIYSKFVQYADIYNIEVAEFKKTAKGESGSYELEYINGYVPPVEPKKSKSWIWVLLGAFLVIAVLIIFLVRSNNKKPEIIEKTVVETVVLHDTVVVKEIEQIEKEYNAAEFKVGDAKISEEAKFVLHDLANAMKKHPEVRLRIEGHTSAEGTESFNQQLSEKRAQAAVDFLIQHEGIDSARLEVVGLGSTQLKNTEDPKSSENRRTEFIVIE